MLLCSFSAGTFWKLHGESFTHREVEKVLDHLHAQKKLVRLKDGRYLTVEALQEIKQKVRELIQRKGSLTLQDGAAILGYGRSKGYSGSRVPGHPGLNSPLSVTNGCWAFKILMSGAYDCKRTFVQATSAYFFNRDVQQKRLCRCQQLDVNTAIRLFKADPVIAK